LHDLVSASLQQLQGTVKSKKKRQVDRKHGASIDPLEEKYSSKSHSKIKRINTPWLQM
jgi:hypothetical protein